MFRMLLGISTKKIQYFCRMCLGLMIAATHHVVEVVNMHFIDAIIVPEPIAEEVSKFFRRFTDIEIVIERVNGVIPAVLYGKRGVLVITTRTSAVFRGENIDSFFILEEKFSAIFSAIFFSKNCFLLNNFNSMVLELYVGGFLQKWRKDFFGQMFGKNKVISQVKALCMEELYGICNIHLILLLVS